MLVIDHAGRAGNGFFQTIFDKHPQVVVCPWIHYIYSYIIEEFGDKETLSCEEVQNFWPQTIYFSLIYEKLDKNKADLITKMGGNPKARIDRQIVKRIFDQYLQRSQTISRQNLVCLIFYSFAIGTGRNLDDVKYVLCTDSISLRQETLFTGFSGKLIEIALADFPFAKLVHLERDPRAGFASSNHQFINQLGNMYGVRYGNFFDRLKLIFKKQLDWDSFFVFGFWMIYFLKTYKTIKLKKALNEDVFHTVLNEQLNLNFSETMHQLSLVLGLKYLRCWDERFQPTMLGLPWTGTGGYNNQYQRNHYGPLKNDSDDVSKNVRGPNVYVTQRWRKRLRKNEILLLECMFADEIHTFGYEFMNPPKIRNSFFHFFIALCKPLSGELPTLSWIRDGFKVRKQEFLNRLFYVFVFPLFYIYVRVAFLRIMKEQQLLKY